MTLLGRVVAKGWVILAAACTVAPGQPLAQTTGANVERPAALTEALNAVTTKYAISQAWFYLRKDDGQTASYTRGDTQGLSQKLWIGSLSKSVTAIGIALLVQDGRLTLHTRLGEVLPRYLQAKGRQLDPSLAPLDIEHLLAHRGGLRANATSDPANGLSSRSMLAKLPVSAHFSDYLLMSGSDTSDGTSGCLWAELRDVLPKPHLSPTPHIRAYRAGFAEGRPVRGVGDVGTGSATAVDRVRRQSSVFIDPADTRGNPIVARLAAD
jgi:hypothetical protein